MAELLAALPLMFAQNAQGRAGGEAPVWQFPLTLGLIVIGFYLLLIRPKQLEDRKRQAMIDALKKNVDMTKELGFAGASFDVKAYSDLSMVQEAAKRLK